MKRFDVVEIIEDVWVDGLGGWNCRYKILSSYDNLQAAQDAHAALIEAYGDIMTPNGWHKYVIHAFTD